MIRNTKENLFFSNELPKEEADKYLFLLVKEPPLVQMQVYKRVWRKKKEVKVPALIISCTGDRCMPMSSTFNMARFLECKTVIFKGLCHDLMLHPKWIIVSKEIEEFIKEQKHWQ